MEAAAARAANDLIPSSSPAFETPAHPFNPSHRSIVPPALKPLIPTILPVQLPPASLRPLAFRTFTKKHNLTLSSAALQALCTFVGRHCGSAWREEGTAEKVLDEVAKTWKKISGPVIVDDGPQLRSTLKLLEGCMKGGRMVQAKVGLSRQSSSFTFADSDPPVDVATLVDDTRPPLRNHSSSFGLSGLDVAAGSAGAQSDEDDSTDVRSWIKIVDAYTQPRLTYNIRKKHFERLTTAPTLLPPPDNKTVLFRDRYNLIDQRVLRNPAFQTPSFNTRKLGRQDSATQSQNFRITPIANLLGRSGSSHLLLGLLVVTPTGSLALHDLSGGITLDLDHARPVEDRPPDETPWLFPGCIVLIEGVYQEEFSGAGSSGLGGGGGVGGMIGGKFVGLTIGNPPCERRSVTLGLVSDSQEKEDSTSVGAGFGWTDFLGVGSEKATGARMRRLEERLLEQDSEAAKKLVILGEVTLDDPDCVEALREVLKRYTSELAAAPPLCFVLVGNFSSHASLSTAGDGSGGSIEYKECLDGLASLLTEFPQLLRKSKWVFVPGDNDPWPSAFSAGSSTVIPRKGVPSLFTNRIKTAFAHAKTDGPAIRRTAAADLGEAIWTTNPSRLTLFGSAHEIVIFRDDISSRMQRTGINYGRTARQEDAEKQQQEQQTAEEDADVVMSGALDTSGGPEVGGIERADKETSLDYATTMGRKIILSLLPQSHLSPFPLPIRPVHWDFGSSLSLYPLPHTLILADAEAPPFAITYEGCHVMNPARLLKPVGKRKKITWIEYDALTKRGEIKTLWQ